MTESTEKKAVKKINDIFKRDIKLLGGAKSTQHDVAQKKILLENRVSTYISH